MLRIFSSSVGAVLVLTGAAKIYSYHTAPEALLGKPDPILMVTTGILLLVVGAVEMFIGIICFMSKQTLFTHSLIAWIASLFLAYRCGLNLVDYKSPCACLGSLTAGLGLDDTDVKHVTRILLGYLLFGSYASLFYQFSAKSRRAARECKELRPSILKI